MSLSRSSRKICLKEVINETDIIVPSKDAYDSLRRICKKYGLNTYVWSSVNTISIFPLCLSTIDLLAPEVLTIHKSQLIDPNWEEIEDLIYFHSLLVTFL